jgi:hypothetical protein
MSMATTARAAFVILVAAAMSAGMLGEEPENLPVSQVIGAPWLALMNAS